MKKMGTFKSSFSVILLSSVLSFAVLNVGSVSAEHEATITISPDITNCDTLGNTFTVNVSNNGGSLDDILQVEIYKAPAGITNFVCGPAPQPGWTLFSFTDRCIYVTELVSPDKIAPSENLNFTFDAIMSSDTCASEFRVVSVDDAFPQGDRDTNLIDVEIDCTFPVIVKDVGTPKIAGSGFDYWVTENTLITLSAFDNLTTDECNLGIDYCQYRITVDGVAGDWILVKNGEVLDWSFYFKEDSSHYLEVECYDIAGHKAILTETDKV